MSGPAMLVYVKLAFQYGSLRLSIATFTAM